MKIFINWQDIQSFDDFYDCFLPQVEAPDWHGRSLEALAESLVNGAINHIEPPFCVIKTNVAAISPDTQKIYAAISDIFEKANEAGRKIRVFDE
jgi:RNAse (barnase) inhibitor barstar